MDPHQQSMLAMGMPYPYAYSYAMPDHLAAAAAGKRSREDGQGEVCRDYLSGKCTRGKNCKYIHYDPYGYGMPVAHPMQQMQQRKTSIEVCMDFQRGTCTRGLDCKYLHVQSPSAGVESGVGTAKRSSEICKDFNRGLCTRGDACRYIHVTIPTINQQAIGGGLPISGGLAITGSGSSGEAEMAEMAKKPKVEGEEGNGDAPEVEQLRAQNQALRARNQQLEEEVAQLRAQLGMPHTGPYGYQPEGTMEGHDAPL